ncbi:MAG: sigma-54-dependent transcriptional regulator [Nitrospiria bacterium]
MEKILVVDDEKSMRDFLAIVLKKDGYYVVTASEGEEAIRVIQKEIFDLVITDIKMSKLNGLEVLRAVKETAPQTIVLMITAYASTETAVEAMKEGAYDYIMKPFQIDEVKLIIKNALEKKKLQEENTRLKRELKDQTAFENIVGRGEKMTKVLDLVQKVSDSNSNILIFGESGTGKELIARAIHFNSRRKDKPFVTVNCSALPETLLESELFGHMKGSFTGAVINKEGLFEVAHEGTLFLDEIGETSMATQVKLLRVLQEKEFRRIGGTKDIKVDVRIIAATNKDLEKAVAQGAFREDLYYRLDVIPIYLPPLRERTEDIALLAEFFLQRFSQRIGKSFRGITPEAMGMLMAQEWKGNVRELENVLERAVALATTDMITPQYLQECLQKPNSTREGLPAEIPTEGVDLENLIGSMEKDLLLKALQKSRGIKKEAARLLRLNFRSFRYRLEKYGIKRDDARNDTGEA